MLQTRITEQFDALIGPRLRLCRLLSFFTIAVLESMSRAHQTIFDAYSWSLSNAISKITDFLKDLPFGEVTVLFLVAFFLVPKLSSVLLATSSAWAIKFAQPMLKAVGVRLDEKKENIPVGELAMLVRRKREGVRLAHATGDVFEVAVLFLFWMACPSSHMGFSASGMIVFAFFVAILWLLGGYAINYLIVTKVLPAEVLARSQ